MSEYIPTEEAIAKALSEYVPGIVAAYPDLCRELAITDCQVEWLTKELDRAQARQRKLLLQWTVIRGQLAVERQRRAEQE